MATMKVIEECFVSPPPGSVLPTTLPLTFLDIHWLVCCPIQRLLFYKFPHNATLYFKQTIIPQLKHSLSLTLEHFFPFAANLIFPPPPHKPFIKYTEGDSLRFVVSESAADFNYLVGHHPRGVIEQQQLVPKLLPPKQEQEQSDLMAIQVTMFPNSGAVSIGFTFMHAVADGTAFIHFMKSWADVQRSCLMNYSKPYHCRDGILDPDDIASTFMKDGWRWNELSSNPTNKVRVTLVLTGVQIEKLKQSIKTVGLNSLPSLHVSTFVVSCAYIWTCLMKLQENDDILSNFIFPANIRNRLEYSTIPETYFGNCLAICFAAAKRSELIGQNGVYVAASAIGREIKELETGALRGAAKWLHRMKEKLKDEHVITVAGSPKFRVYETDFGWGKPEKTESAHIGINGAVAIADSRDHDGGVEFGLALDVCGFNALSYIFQQGFGSL